MRRLIILVTLLVLQSGAHSAPGIDVYNAQFQAVPREQLVDGIVEATQRATVSAQTSGTITHLAFDVNDRVAKGDVIAEFKNTEQKAALKRAEANLEDALAQQRDAEAEYERLNKVFKQGAVSKSQMDKATAAMKSTKARVTAAQAGLTAAKEQFDYTLIRAPYSGIVIERHAEVGEAAKPGTPIMTGLSLDDLRILTQVPQQMIESVSKYAQARILPADDGPEGITSNLVTVFPYADTASHSFSVRIELPHGVEKLYPGMYVKVAFLTGEDRKILVPKQAVVRRSEVTAVYVVGPDDRISMRQIRIGREHGDGLVEVLSGLDEGESVAMDPQAVLIRIKKAK